jgi:thioesterase domain-containing protein
MRWGYENLARHLDPDQPMYFLQCHAARGLPESSTIEGMAAAYVRELIAVQPEGPYHLGGYCFGGNVAFEMARQLSLGGARVGAVVLINSVPANSAYDVMRWTPVNTWKFCRNLAYWAVQLTFSPTARSSELLAWKWRTLCNKLSRWLRPRGRGRGLPLPELVDLADLPDPTHRDRWVAHLRAFCRFRPQPYAGNVLLLRTRGHQMFCTFAPDYGWGEFARGGVDVRVLHGEHESILLEPHVSAAAAVLTGELRRHETDVRHPMRRWELAQWLPAFEEPLNPVGAVAGT